MAEMTPKLYQKVIHDRDIKIAELEKELKKAKEDVSDIIDDGEGEVFGYILTPSSRTNKAETERDGFSKHLGNLLARIHRDGGHYQAEHGTSKAAYDAEVAWSTLMVKLDDAQTEIKQLRAEGTFEPDTHLRNVNKKLRDEVERLNSVLTDAWGKFNEINDGQANTMEKVISQDEKITTMARNFTIAQHKYLDTIAKRDQIIELARDRFEEIKLNLLACDHGACKGCNEAYAIAFEYTDALNKKDQETIPTPKIKTAALWADDVITHIDLLNVSGETNAEEIIQAAMDQARITGFAEGTKAAAEYWEQRPHDCRGCNCKEEANDIRALTPKPEKL